MKKFDDRVMEEMLTSFNRILEHVPEARSLLCVVDYGESLEDAASIKRIAAIGRTDPEALSFAELFSLLRILNVASRTLTERVSYMLRETEKQYAHERMELVRLSTELEKARRYLADIQQQLPATTESLES